MALALKPSDDVGASVSMVVCCSEVFAKLIAPVFKAFYFAVYFEKYGVASSPWRSKPFLDIVPFVEVVYCGLVAFIKIFGPVLKHLCFISNSYKKRVSSVVYLGFAACPSAVFGLVVSVVVDSVNRCSSWLLTHVRKEVFERVFPSLANSYSSASVFAEGFVSGVGASVSEVLPGVVRSGSTEAMCFVGVDRKAPARSYPFFFEMICSYCGKIAAFAFTKPSGLASDIFSFSNNGKSANLMACAVNKIIGGHNGSRS